MKKDLLNWRLILTFCLLLIFVIGCAGQETGIPLVWIDVPVQDLTVPLGATINIEGHTNDTEEISYVELLIDGNLVWTIDEIITSGGLGRFTQLWTPEEEGDYIIHAVAFRSSEEFSSPASVTVHVGSIDVAQVSEEEPSIGDDTTAPEQPPQETTVQFWASPPEIQAGSCTILHWLVENSQKVLLGKTEVSADGDFEACHCKSTSYTLTVIHQDGTEEANSLPITVLGDCVTPEPEIDVIPPPVPLQLKPLNGSDIGCVSDTFLRWQSVTDESGIAQYQIQVQRHSGDNNWVNVAGSPWTGISDTKKLLTTECGWTYRWRIRAIDNADNVGSWSGWFTFNLPLT